MSDSQPYPPKEKRQTGRLIGGHGGVRRHGRKKGGRPTILSCCNMDLMLRWRIRKAARRSSLAGAEEQERNVRNLPAFALRAYVRTSVIVQS